MGFLGLIALVVLALLAIAVKLIVDSVQEKNWKKTAITAAAFCAAVAIMYFGLIHFITSM